MHFSAAFLTFTTACTVSARALSIFLPPVGNLPSQSTTGSRMSSDFSANDNAVQTLGGSVQKALDFNQGNPGGDDSSYVRDILEKLIEFQGTTNTARLDTQDISSAFSVDDSSAIADKLKNAIVPHLNTTTALLLSAKKAGIIGAKYPDLPGVVAPLGMVDYMTVLQNAYTEIKSTLPLYINSVSVPDVSTSLDTIIQYLNTTLAAIVAS